MVRPGCGRRKAVSLLSFTPASTHRVNFLIPRDGDWHDSATLMAAQINLFYLVVPHCMSKFPDPNSSIFNARKKTDTSVYHHLQSKNAITPATAAAIAPSGLTPTAELPVEVGEVPVMVAVVPPGDVDVVCEVCEEDVLVVLALVLDSELVVDVLVGVGELVAPVLHCSR